MEQKFVLSDNLKALIRAYVKDNTAENLIEVFTQFGQELNACNQDLEFEAKELKAVEKFE